MKRQFQAKEKLEQKVKAKGREALFLVVKRSINTIPRRKGKERDIENNFDYAFD